MRIEGSEGCRQAARCCREHAAAGSFERSGIGLQDRYALLLEADAEQEVADFFDPYIRETHPCKDASGEALWHFEEPLYTLMVDNVYMPGCAKP